MMKTLIAAFAVMVPIIAQAQQAAAPTTTTAPNGVTFYGAPTAAISSGAVIPANRSWLWISGTTPAIADSNAKPGTHERFGDTRTQAASILKNIAGQLERQGLTMRDVVYLRAYLVPDPTKGTKIDVDGWNAAYGEVFGTSANPIKPARSTVGVVSLVNADWLIEIEAFAVVPEKK